MDGSAEAAPDWIVTRWFNSDNPRGDNPRDDNPSDLSTLRGRVVIAAAFQMLCPGCVEHTIPQLKRAHAFFPPDHVAVVGLHTVFEHHDAMRPSALAAFLHEYEITFPVGVDTPGQGGDPIPSTMRRYDMRGTPTMLLIDRAGRLRRQTFGHVPDLQLGAEVMSLVHEDVPVLARAAPASAGGGTATRCDETGCRI